MTPPCDAPPLKEIDEAYDAPGWWYNIRGYFILRLSYRDSLLSQIRFFARHLSPHHLEAAAGTGTLLKLVLAWRKLGRRPAAKVVAFDTAEAMLAAARRAFRDREDVRVLTADAARLDFPDGTFLSVSLANAFHCLHEPARVLAELCRILAPGGTLAMNVLTHPRGWTPFRWIPRRVNAWGMRKGILFSPYTPEEVRGHVRSAGFEIVEERLRGNSFYVVCRNGPPC